MTTSAWIVLLAPLAGFLVIALSSKVLPWRVHGWIGTLAIAVSFGAAVATLIALQGRGEEERQVVSVGVGLRRRAGGVDAQVSILIDPLVGDDDLRRLRRLDADPPVLGRPTWRPTGATRASSRT